MSLLENPDITANELQKEDAGELENATDNEAFSQESLPSTDLQDPPSSAVDPLEPYTVRLTSPALTVRKGPGTDYDAVKVLMNDKNVHTIIEEADGAGAKRWGRLKTGIGWISLDYASKL